MAKMRYLVFKIEDDISVEDIRHLQLITRNGEIIHVDETQVMSLENLENYKIDLSYHRQIEYQKWLTQSDYYSHHIEHSKCSYVKNVLIDLRYNSLDTTQLKSILELWKGEDFWNLCQKMFRIDISQNRIDMDGFIEIFQFIRHYCPNLKFLEANINFLKNSELEMLRQNGLIPDQIIDRFGYSSY